MDRLLKKSEVLPEYTDLLESKSDYNEAFPHLRLMVFRQRMINGNGYIEREYDTSPKPGRKTGFSNATEK